MQIFVNIAILWNCIHMKFSAAFASLPAPGQKNDIEAGFRNIEMEEVVEEVVEEGRSIWAGFTAKKMKTTIRGSDSWLTYARTSSRGPMQTGSTRPSMVSPTLGIQCTGCDTVKL
jgi:hypothetical protein